MVCEDMIRTEAARHLSRGLLLLLLLQVLVRAVGDGAADEEDGVQADADARGVGVVAGAGRAGGGLVGGRVAGLARSTVSFFCSWFHRGERDPRGNGA